VVLTLYDGHEKGQGEKKKGVDLQLRSVFGTKKEEGKDFSRNKKGKGESESHHLLKGAKGKGGKARIHLPLGGKGEQAGFSRRQRTNEEEKENRPSSLGKGRRGRKEKALAPFARQFYTLLSGEEGS